MPRTTGRSHDDTRRLLLDAAATIVRDRGLAATLDEIAREAGVSKGGLLYHFATKDELILALADDVLGAFRNAVQEALDPADAGAGRLTRAYIWASFHPRSHSLAARQEMSLIAQLLTRPDVAELAHRDAARWRQELADDGLPADVRDLVVAASDGIGASALWGDTPEPADLMRLRDQLLSFTRQTSLTSSRS